MNDKKGLLVAISGKTMVMTLDRPGKLNALDTEMLLALKGAVEKLQSDSFLRGGIITGCGEKAFAAGADIANFQGIGQEEGSSKSKLGQEVFFKIENCHKPIVACVNGYALGGGFELALACHLRFAAPNAWFGFPETTLGLLPGYGGTQRLAALIGKGRSLEVMLSASNIDAQQALAMGLVNRIVPISGLVSSGMAWLEEVARRPDYAIAAVITAVNAFPNGFDLERKLFGECLANKDAQNHIDTFLNKNKRKKG